MVRAICWADYNTWKHPRCAAAKHFQFCPVINGGWERSQLVRTCVRMRSLDYSASASSVQGWRPSSRVWPVIMSKSDPAYPLDTHQPVTKAVFFKQTFNLDRLKWKCITTWNFINELELLSWTPQIQMSLWMMKLFNSLKNKLKGVKVVKTQTSVCFYENTPWCSAPNYQNESKTRFYPTYFNYEMRQNVLTA